MSAQKRYLEMFQSPFFQAEERDWLRERVDREIKWARRNLEKSDKIVWYLRAWKYQTMTRPDPLVSSSTSNSSEQPLFTAKETKWLRQFEEKQILPSDPDGMLWHEIKSGLQHFFDLGVYHIDNMQFGNRSWADIESSMNAHEEAWIEAGSDRSVAEYGTKILKLPDGSAWFDLERAGCDIEGDAMRHCGNGAGSHGQNMYSLRTPDPNNPGYWTPRVTVIMNDVDQGTLGEIKGYGNQKPSTKYHDAMIEFVKLDIVTRLEGGGYLPQNNFMLSDLTPEQQALLYQDKESLFDAFATWKMCDKQVNDRVLSKLKVELGTQLEERKGGLVMELRDGPNIEDFATDFDMDTLKGYAETLQEAHCEIYEFDEDVYSDELGSILDSLMLDPKNRDVTLKMRHYLSTQYADTLDDEDLDLDDGDDIFKLYQQTQDDHLGSMFRKATLWGLESGTYGEIYSAYRAVLDQFPEKYPGLTVEQDGPSSQWRLFATPEALMMLQEEVEAYANDYIEDFDPTTVKDNIFTYLSECEDVDFEDMDNPQNGFMGWDEVSAQDGMDGEMSDAFCDMALPVETPTPNEPFEATTSQRAIDAFIDKKSPSPVFVA